MEKLDGFLLVVDDNEINRDLLSRRLEQRGHRVLTASGGRQALEMVAQHDFDLILLDIMMPEVNGLEVLKTLRETRSMSELPIIMVTAVDESEGVVEALNLGANDYVTKPVDFPVVFARIRTQLSLKRSDDALREAKCGLEQQVAERTAELKATGERLRMAMYAARMGVWEWDFTVNRMNWEGHYLQLFGLVPETFDGTYEAFLNVVYPEDRALIQQQIVCAVEKSTPFSIEFRIVHPDGSVRWMSSQGQTYCDETGRALRIIGVVQDITERNQALEALQESDNHLRSLIEHLPDGVCLLDTEHRVILSNPTAEACLGVVAKLAEDRTISRIGELAVEEVLSPKQDGMPHEVMVDELPEKRFFEVDASPFGEKKGGWVLVIREVTQERLIQDKMQQQERLAAVGQLAAGIAHDFNNLLTVMMGTAQIIEMRSDVPDALIEDMRHIYTQGERAAQLVKQVLDFSRQSVVQRRVIDLAPFLKETVKMLERTLPETIRIVTDFDGQTFPVLGNITQFQQVITNLSVNARDAMPKGGELRIGLSHMRLASGQLPPVPDMEAGHWIAWTVSDTGTGMPPEVLAHIFEPFFTTKERGKGTGLGLAQVYGIVKADGGSINVESERGGGTKFTIYLPWTDEQEVVGISPDFGVLEGLGETILVVEDEPGVQKVAKGLLEALNFQVLTASNGLEGLEVYEAHRNEIALVLADIVMPKMGGRALFEALKERDPTIRVVMMTGYAKEEGGSRLPEDIAGFLEKPLEMGQIARVLNHVLNS